MEKNFLSKKEVGRLNKMIKKIEKDAQEIALNVMKLFFHYLGEEITKEKGKSLPMEDGNNYVDFLAKIKSTDVLVLTDFGTMTAFYSYGNKNEWTLKCAFDYKTLKPEDVFENKYLYNKSDIEWMNNAVTNRLLGINDFNWIENALKEEKEKRISHGTI